MILATDEDAKVKDAVALRFKELCEERNLSPNALAVRSDVTPSTVYSMLDSSQQSVTVPTVKKLCDGLGITLVDFLTLRFSPQLIRKFGKKCIDIGLCTLLEKYQRCVKPLVIQRSNHSPDDFLFFPI